jgi:AcrR family transcriptional regulator
LKAMAQHVKRRSYDTTSREAGSRETKRRIMAAARETIMECGYRGATVAQIAEKAHVNVDTIYSLAGRKPEILRELIEEAISGADQPITAEQRGYVRAIRAEPDPRRKLAIYANATCAIQTRLAPLFLALRDAARTEPEAEQIWLEISSRRATNMRKLAAEIRDAGALRHGLTIREAADVLWATNSSELFLLMTVERRWSVDRYERWLADTWERLLL